MSPWKLLFSCYQHLAAVDVACFVIFFFVFRSLSLSLSFMLSFLCLFAVSVLFSHLFHLFAFERLFSVSCGRSHGQISGDDAAYSVVHISRCDLLSRCVIVTCCHGVSSHLRGAVCICVLCFIVSI